MCLILDTNCLLGFCDSKNEDLKPVRKWLGIDPGKNKKRKSKGYLAYSPVDKLRREYLGKKAPPKFEVSFRVLRRRGIVKFIEKEVVEKEMKGLTNIESDDPHILALARVADARLLVSQNTQDGPADQALVKDFKKIVKGKVYCRKKHRNLLNKHVCKKLPNKLKRQ